MTVRIHIWATTDAEPVLVLDDLGSKFRGFGHDKVTYDLERVDIEKPIDVDSVDDQQAQAGEDATP